jgi:hypothetical protein
MSLKNIDKIKTLKINNNYKKYWILIFLIIALILIWNYSYNTFYYNNQIIKVWNKINFKKIPDSIEYFNNNKINIIPEKIENHILTQSLMWYRNISYNEYKNAWYNVFYSKETKLWKIIKENILEEYKQKDIFIEEEIKNNNIIIVKYNEKLDRKNLYKTENFKNLNNFTNINTFYSNISNTLEFNTNSKVKDFIYKNFDLNYIFNNLDESFYNVDLINKKIWLDYKDNFLILRINYLYNKKEKVLLKDAEDINFYKIPPEYLDDLWKNIKEESLLLYEESKIYSTDSNTYIEIKFSIDLDKINKNFFTNLY